MNIKSAFFILIACIGSLLLHGQAQNLDRGEYMIDASQRPAGSNAAHETSSRVAMNTKQTMAVLINGRLYSGGLMFEMMNYLEEKKKVISIDLVLDPKEIRLYTSDPLVQHIMKIKVKRKVANQIRRWHSANAKRRS